MTSIRVGHVNQHMDGNYGAHDPDLLIFKKLNMSFSKLAKCAVGSMERMESHRTLVEALMAMCNSSIFHTQSFSILNNICMHIQTSGNMCIHTYMHAYVKEY